MSTYTCLFSNGTIMVTDKESREEAERFFRINRESDSYAAFEGSDMEPTRAFLRVNTEQSPLLTEYLNGTNPSAPTRSH